MTDVNESTWPYATTTTPNFLAAFQREHEVTRKVMEAYPADHAAFKPHPTSTSAIDLAWTFVLEEQMMLMALRKEPILGGKFGKAPDSWQAVLDAFTKQHAELVAELERIGDGELSHTVEFYTAPKQKGDYPAMKFLWFLLCDQIHHRGQLSVYSRMNGGKIPSIYGPSLDEPFF